VIAAAIGLGLIFGAWKKEDQDNAIKKQLQKTALLNL